MSSGDTSLVVDVIETEEPACSCTPELPNVSPVQQPVEELFESFNGLPLLSGVFQQDPLQWATPTGASPKTRGSVEERGSSTGC
jgi:hypothetical protein